MLGDERRGGPHHSSQDVRFAGYTDDPHRRPWDADERSFAGGWPRLAGTVKSACWSSSLQQDILSASTSQLEQQHLRAGCRVHLQPPAATAYQLLLLPVCRAQVPLTMVLTAAAATTGTMSGQGRTTARRTTSATTAATTARQVRCVQGQRLACLHDH